MSTKSTGVAEPLLFQIPLIKQFVEFFGCVEPASKEGMKAILARKVPFGILPGKHTTEIEPLVGRQYVAGSPPEGHSYLLLVCHSRRCASMLIYCLLLMACRWVGGAHLHGAWQGERELHSDSATCGGSLYLVH
jgi:hypothetical protein